MSNIISFVFVACALLASVESGIHGGHGVITHPLWSQEIHHGRNHYSVHHSGPHYSQIHLPVVHTEPLANLYDGHHSGSCGGHGGISY